MKSQNKLPKILITAINRLANEELRQAVWSRAKVLRAEYTGRIGAGEPIETLTGEVETRTAKAILESHRLGGK